MDEHTNTTSTIDRNSNEWRRGHADGVAGTWNERLAECEASGDAYVAGWAEGNAVRRPQKPINRSA